MKLECLNCGHIADIEEFKKSVMVEGLVAHDLHEETEYRCPAECGAKSDDYEAEGSEIIQVKPMQWMVTVLFDTGADNYHEITVFVEGEGDPKGMAVPIAVRQANEEYCSEEMEKEIVDVLIYERKSIERGFEKQLVKAEV